MRGSRIVAPFLGILCLWLGCSGSEGKEDRFIRLRENMVRRQLMARDIHSEDVLAAMRAVPRHLFVPPEYRHLAYADHPLPIGGGQTISQPYIVALMTQSLGLRKGDKVLEIGTGSGYQAAVLSELTDEVYSQEIVPELAELASATLSRIGYTKVRIRCSDGHLGWADEAPFDAVIITCASPNIPPLLFEQLREGGRMILPLGDPKSHQVLTLVTKRNLLPVRKSILDVRFVPMTKR